MSTPAPVHSDMPRDTTLTLSGWRRFVESSPPQLALLPDTQWTQMSVADRDTYDEQRIDYHSEMIVVATSAVREVTHRGRLLTLLNRREISARRGLIVSGPSTTGKSTALKQLGRTHERFWARQEDVICPSHWVWTGTTSSLDLSSHPKVASEVITANRRHRRLIRRRGRLAVRAAYYDAKKLCWEWNKIGIFNKKISRRLTDILGPKWSVRHDDPESEAAYYPNVIELTRILSSPYWRSLILDEHLPASTPREPFELLGVPADFCWLMESTPGIELFVQEIRRTVNPYFSWHPYSHYGSYPAFTKWVLDELRERFSPSPYRHLLRPTPEVFGEDAVVSRRVV
ncbi:hypothetical protein [Streptomyces lunaelactis]|uniref:hypothetical protein n=1 Tax=Streptomyces lunaelactis TaxID=1535768 RepID=UPI001584BF9C|nr:hypothetical protein [Streptomyces lunaelactis]NUK85434.1 hypothetical protein [Streptomyces lunaelactis]